MPTDSGIHLDARDDRRILDTMATRKRARPAKEAQTKGAVLAAKYRARANSMTDEERQQHRARAMSLIYGKPNGPTVHAGRR